MKRSRRISPANRYFLDRVWPCYLEAQKGYQRRLSNRVYRQRHPDRVATAKRIYRAANSAKIAKRDRRYRKLHSDDISVKKRAYKERNREHITAHDSAYRRAHRAEINAHKRHRTKSDVLFRLSNNLRKRVSNALNGRTKSAPTLALLGCSVDMCRAHLERQFTDGMTWDNRTEWHVDHIRPVASYDLSDPRQQRACFHYSNLQPLWARDNLSKGARY